MKNKKILIRKKRKSSRGEGKIGGKTEENGRFQGWNINKINMLLVTS